MLQIVLGGGGEAELVTHKVIEYGAGVAADGAMSFIGDHQIEIGGREERLVFVVEQKRLNRADHDLRAAPIVAVFFVDDGFAVVGQ